MHHTNAYMSVIFTYKGGALQVSKKTSSVRHHRARRECDTKNVSLPHKIRQVILASNRLARALKKQRAFS